MMQRREAPCPSALVSRPLDQAGIAGQPGSIHPARELTVPCSGFNGGPLKATSPQNLRICLSWKWCPLLWAKGQTRLSN